MKTNAKRNLLTILMLTVLLMLTAVPAYAGTQKQAAMKAYKAFLSTKGLTLYPESTDTKLSFATAYINKDSVPELIVKDKGYFAIYTYKNGKVKTLLPVDTMGALTKYYPKKNYIVIDHTNMNDIMYQTLSGAKRLRIFLGTRFKINAKEEYKELTKKQFQKELKKIVGSTKAKKPKFYRNTKTNRKKHLK